MRAPPDKNNNAEAVSHESREAPQPLWVIRARGIFTEFAERFCFRRNHVVGSKMV